MDGVSSKVGRSCGQRDWPSLATHVQLSMRWSALLGIGAVPLLLGLRRPLCGGLLALSGEVQAAAAPYWVLRTWLIPLQLLNMSAAGILQVGVWANGSPTGRLVVNLRTLASTPDGHMGA